MSSFINRIARQRIEARQADQVDAPGVKGPGGAPQGQPVEGPELRPGGRPAPKKASPGLNAALMRQTVADVFTAGEKLGLGGPLLARHQASLSRITDELNELAKTMAKGLRGKPAETQAALKNLPAQLIGEMSAGLTALDPAGAAKTISTVLNLVTELMRGEAPNGDQLRAMIGVAYAAGQLSSGGMGEAVADAARLIRGSNANGAALSALVRTLTAAMGAINGTGAAREELFGVTVATMLKALSGEGDTKAMATAANAAAGNPLSDGQVDIAAAQANAARQAKAQVEQQDAQAAQQLGQARAAFDGNPKLAALAGIREQAGALLSTKGQLLWHQQVNAHAGQPDHVVQALGQLLLTYLARVGREAIPDRVVADAASHFVALAQIEGVTAQHLTGLAGEHAGVVDHTELGGTLKLTGDLLRKLDGAARGRLLAAGPVEADGSSALVALANTLGRQTERYARAEGPLNTLVATLNAAADDASVSMAARRGVRFAAEIPNTENGGIVERLRNHLPQDLATAAKAGLDPAAVAATHPTLPADSLPRLIALGVEGGKDSGKWLTDLEKFFKAARGNKEHTRNLRTLVAAAADAGVDATRLVGAFLKSGMSAQVLTKTVQAMLNETGYAPDKAYLDGVIGGLEKGDSVYAQIQERMQGKLMKDLNLGALLGEGAKVKVTEKGLGEVKGELAPFFRTGAGNAVVPQDILKGFLVAVLEDRADSYRFETPVAAAHLAPLSERAKQAWMKPQVMMHVRFDGDGQARFGERVRSSAQLGELLRGRMEGAWGKLDDLVAKQTQLSKQLRDIDKNDRAGRAALVKEIRGLPGKVSALEWATKVAAMTPENVTPEKFLALGDELMAVRRSVGPAGHEAMDALMYTLKLADISYSQVVTDDGPDFPTIYKLATTNCLKWPGYGGEVLGYQADPNKRFVVTKNQAGEMRRAVLRLVERQDAEHKGEPMLILERTYPDRVTAEEKQRLMEHTLRRAAEMGVACGFATEYYWDASKTARGRGNGLVDMNETLTDLAKRYDSQVDKKVLDLLNRASNFSTDYMDSAPPNGAAGAGQVSYRGHKEKTDKAFQNEFIVMTPK
jgi:hypothetical protein